MIKTLFDSLKLETELMHKFKDSSALIELEIYILAKANIKLLKERILEQIAFDAYWEQNYEQRKGGDLIINRP